MVGAALIKIQTRGVVWFIITPFRSLAVFSGGSLEAIKTQLDVPKTLWFGEDFCIVEEQIDDPRGDTDR